MCLFHKTVGGKDKKGKIAPEDIKIKTDNFGNNLDETITDVQKLADAVDDLELGGVGSLPSGQIEGELLRWDGWNWVVSPFLRIDNDAYIYIQGWAGGTSEQQVMVDSMGMLYLSPVSNGGGSSPTGTTNQTLRYGTDNNIESTNCLQVADAQSWGSSKSSQVKIIPNVEPYLGIPYIFMNADEGRFGHCSSIQLSASEICFSNWTLDDSGNGRISFSDSTNLYIVELGLNLNNQNYILHCVDSFDGTIYAGITKNGTLTLNSLTGTGTRPLVALEDGTLAVGEGRRNYLEFISQPIDEGNSTSYVGYSNTQLGLDGINLIDKVKSLQAYVILSGESKLNSGLISGKEIDSGMILISTNTPLVEGDRVKLYIEYID